MPSRFFGKIVRVSGTGRGTTGGPSAACGAGRLRLTPGRRPAFAVSFGPGPPAFRDFRGLVLLWSLLAPAIAAGLSTGGAALPADPAVRAGPPGVSAAGQGGQPAPTSIYRADSPAALSASRSVAASSASREAGQGERLVAASLAALVRQPAIVAELRQSAIVSGRRFVGAGRYVQSGLGEDQRFRFESSLAGEAETFHFLEVADGVAFWSFEKHGDLAPSIHRVDLRSVRRKLEGFGPRIGHGDAVTPHLGGVQRVLSRVREWFRFEQPESVLLAAEPAWSVTGRWSPEGLARLVPERLRGPAAEGRLEAADLPQGMPWQVRLVLGKRDLFPYRIEWLAVPGPRPAADRRIDLVGLLEFHDVQLGGAVDASAFVYRPAAEGLIDATVTFLEGVHPLRP
jgi:hypothetical protein